MQPVWGQQVIQLALPFLPFMIILYLSIPPFHCTPPFLSSLFSFVPFLFFLTLCSQPLGPKLVFFPFLSCVAGLALIGSSLPFYPSSKISPENTSNVVLIWSVWQTKKKRHHECQSFAGFSHRICCSSLVLFHCNLNAFCSLGWLVDNATNLTSLWAFYRQNG